MMNDWREDFPIFKDKRLKLCMLSTFLFGLITHAFSYYETWSDFMEYVMGYNVNCLPREQSEAMAETANLTAILCFPEAGYCQMIEGVMVIKFFAP